MVKSLRLFFILCAVVAFAACDDDTGSSGKEPPAPGPETIVFTQSNLVYRGDDIDSGQSDLWLLTLYTDMQVDGAGNPVGPGKMMRLSINARLGSGPDLENLVGMYGSTKSTGDFSAGTYNPGFINRIDLPTGMIESPDGSFYGELAAGQTTFEPDLLRDRGFSVALTDADTYTVAGEIVGDHFLKRSFRYEGKLAVVDRSDPVVPNTTLDADLTLDAFTKARIEDCGDIFFTGSETFRLFEIFLAEEDIDFTQTFPAGDGRVLRLELLVPWETVAADGIPAGTYTMFERNADKSIDRDKLAPWSVVPGYPDKFTLPSGSWYQFFKNDVMTQYACLNGGGTVTVDRSGGAHRLVIELTDAGAPAAHKVRCTYSQSAPIDVYDRYK